MNKIYLVISEFYDRYTIVRGFTTRQYAEDFIKECQDKKLASYYQSLVIEEIEIDK